jgi:predicted MFS family arabinose efflux permease
VFASHQVGAAIAASAAGILRTEQGSYDLAWFAAAALCMVAAGLSLALLRSDSRRVDGDATNDRSLV